MEDMERYGDYNEYDESPTKRSGAISVIIKVMVMVAFAALVGVIGFRMILFEYYPDAMKNIYFTEGLTEYYEQTDGNIDALTQSLRAPYDDAERGNFFCDNLIVVKGAGELQITLRYNVSLIESIEKELGLTGLSADDADLFSFRLYKSGESKEESDHLIGTLAAEPMTDSVLMYRYYKLAFTDIDFGQGSDKIEWLRLEIFVKGQTSSEPFAKVAIYEDNEDYSQFEEYKLSNSEVPR